MATTAELRAPAGRHGLALHGVARTAVYVMFGIGAIFSGVLATAGWLAEVGSHGQGIVSLTSPDSVIGNLIQAVAATGLCLASLAGVVGLARGREWGRRLLTYACGLWAASLVFLPVSIGLMMVLWHTDLPERPRHLVGRLLAGIRDQSSTPSGPRAVVTALLALTALVFVVHQSAVLVTDSGHDSAGFVVAMAVFTAIEALVFAVAIIGIGRSLPWGGPAALFVCGMCLFSFLAYPLTLIVLFILVRSRSLWEFAAPGIEAQT